MNRICVMFLTLGLMVALNSPLFSQLELPRKSPVAKTANTIGYTEIEIVYSSPAVKGRTVWGDIVPYDQVWRAGANEATTISFSTDLMIEGANLPKGKYAFFLIPQEGDTWTAVFNKTADQWGAYQYDESQDALRIPVGVKTLSNPEERLTYSIVEQDLDLGYIRFGWESKVVYLRFQTDLLNTVKQKIDEAIAKAPAEDHWKVYSQAADFLADSDRYTDWALNFANQSTELFDHSSNWWTKARLEAKKGDYKAAVESAAKAAEVGKANAEDKFYAGSKERIEQTVSEWKTKL
ncbi:MAG: DUF2911 domain-containing protein [Lewinellaceae bacterium]|nr:DUF2911 domain-containing protein [Lewinella sp.]MCB9281957.1 DUF2911 domain-containing protein [Lewinellaceae bacterium]